MGNKKLINELYRPKESPDWDIFISNLIKDPKNNLTEKEGNLIKHIVKKILSSCRIVRDSEYANTNTWLYIDEIEMDGALINRMYDENKINSFLVWQESMVPHILKLVMRYMDRNIAISETLFTLAITYGVMYGLYEKYFNGGKESITESTEDKIKSFLNKVVDYVLNDTTFYISNNKTSIHITSLPFTNLGHNYVDVDIDDIIELSRNEKPFNYPFSLMEMSHFYNYIKNMYGVSTLEMDYCWELYKTKVREKFIDLWKNRFNV